MTPTRHPELGYTHYCGIWRFVCTDTGSTVGPIYHTKVEMLADLGRYYRDSWAAAD